MPSSLAEHRRYVADTVRVSAYSEALAKLVPPEGTVVDLGSGTGILGLLACRAGARRVYAIDRGGLIETVRDVFRANGFADRLVTLRGLSTQVEIPERADVVVADQLGAFGFEAGILDYFADAARRFLRPGGRLIPSEIRFHVAAVECHARFDEIAFWASKPSGIDFGVVHAKALESEHTFEPHECTLLTEPALAGSATLGESGDAPMTLCAKRVVQKAGTLHGIAGWFSARLADDVWMTNSPVASPRINRPCAFFPIASPVNVEPGDEVDIRFTVRPLEPLVAWNVTVARRDAPPVTFRHSTFGGLLLSREDIDRARADAASAPGRPDA